ncbi:hypothetical protein EAF04_004224 [Stromatinia cepivora]|nr:hypothetical protein EAF04_004224 [Stromatinia cepivora]
MNMEMQGTKDDHYDLELDSDVDLEIDADVYELRFPNTPSDFWKLAKVLNYKQFAVHTCNMNEVFVPTARPKLTMSEKRAAKKSKASMNNSGGSSSTSFKPNTSGNRVTKPPTAPEKSNQTLSDRQYIVARRTVDEAWYTRVHEAYAKWPCPKAWSLDKKGLALREALMQTQSDKANEFWETRARLAGNPELAEMSTLSFLLNEGLIDTIGETDNMTDEERAKMMEDSVYGREGDEATVLTTEEQMIVDEQMRLIGEHSANALRRTRYDGDDDFKMS